MDTKGKLYYRNTTGQWEELKRMDSGKTIVSHWDKTLRNKILTTTIFAALFGILGGFGVGFAVGFQAGTEFQRGRDEKQKTIRTGYTVLDAERVVMASGDTVSYQWNKWMRK